MGIHTGIGHKHHAWDSHMPLFLQQITGRIYCVPETREAADTLMGMVHNGQDREETFVVIHRGS